MKSLRQQKKAINKYNILKAAEEIFLEKGFKKTTTAQIASKAFVAEGTLYNYFSSKNEILISLFFNSFLNEVYKFDYDNIKKESYFAELTNFLKHHLKPLKEIDRNLLKESIAIIVNNNPKNKTIKEGFEEINCIILNQIREYLLFGKENKYLKAKTAITKLEKNLFAVISYVIIRYAANINQKYDDFIKELESHIKFSINL